VQHLFAGLAAAAAGLLVAMAVKVAKPLRHARAAAGIAALAFVAIAMLRMPLLTTMLVLTPVSIWLASRRRDPGTPPPAQAAARDTQPGGRP
jgi:chromate transporter